MFSDWAKLIQKDQSPPGELDMTRLLPLPSLVRYLDVLHTATWFFLRGSMFSAVIRIARMGDLGQHVLSFAFTHK